jgi:very-short-patch-repair endonuclease
MLVVEVDGGYYADRIELDAMGQWRLERAGY